jgi:septum formation protein
MFHSTRIYLASGSPRRRALLEQIGVHYEPLAVTVEETPLSGEQPQAYVARLALAKAQAGWAMLPKWAARPVLGADTSVVMDGAILGKPRDRQEGLVMLNALSGRTHQVFSAVALVMGEREAVRVQESWVQWRSLSPEECTAYWETGEPLDKAGGYGIQGRAAAFIAELRGSYSGVMGLPLFETAELMREFDLPIL